MLSTQERFLFAIFAGIAVVAITIGWGLPSTGTNILKDIMVFFSGAGMAYVLAAAGTRATSHRDAEAARERLRSLCNRSVQRLGLTASQTLIASTLVRDHMARPSESTAELIAAILENAAEQAEVSIGDLEEMAGAKISLDELVSNALSSMHKASEDLPKDVQQKLNEIMKPLEQIKDTGGLSPSPVIVSCPNCVSRLTVSLGDIPGTTAHTRCGSCFTRVIVHRGSDGSLVAKPFGRLSVGVSPPSKAEAIRSILEVTCPSCRANIPLNLRPSDAVMIVRNCFTCNERLYIDSQRRLLVRSEKTIPLKAPSMVFQGKSYLSCPSCMNTIRLNFEPTAQRKFKTTCSHCTSLIEAFPLGEQQSNDSEATIEARRAYAQGDLIRAADKLGVILDRSGRPETGQTPTTSLAVQKAFEGHLALAKGDLVRAKGAYEAAEQIGLYPVFSAINQAMVGLLSGSPEQARLSLSIVSASAAGPFMRVQLELLRAVCTIEESGTCDLAALTDARSKCQEFDLSRSPLQHLKSGLMHVSKYTDAMARVFEAI